MNLASELIFWTRIAGLYDTEREYIENRAKRLGRQLNEHEAVKCADLSVEAQCIREDMNAAWKQATGG